MCVRENGDSVGVCECMCVCDQLQGYVAPPVLLSFPLPIYIHWASRLQCPAHNRDIFLHMRCTNTHIMMGTDCYTCMRNGRWNHMHWGIKPPRPPLQVLGALYIYMCTVFITYRGSQCCSTVGSQQNVSLTIPPPPHIVCYSSGAAIHSAWSGSAVGVLGK